MEVKRATAIAEAIEQLVFTGEIENGARLDEIRLAERFGVSRTPIREALQLLVHSGLAEQKPRRGVFVRQPGPVDLLEMFETMAELEAACGRFAAGRMSDDALARARAAHLRCEEAALANDFARYYDENEVFHREIYAGSGNSFLENEARRLQGRLKPFRRMQLRVRGRMEQSMAEHLEVLAALAAGKAEAAAEALRSHVSVQGERFQQMIASLKN